MSPRQYATAGAFYFQYKTGLPLVKLQLNEP